MDIPTLIQFCSQRLVYLNSLLATATVTGNAEEVAKLEVAIAVTNGTIEQLKTLLV